MLKKSQLKKLPNEKGVYLFYKNNQPLYVGKSVNIKARVLTHWKSAKIDKKEALIISQSNQIRFYLTDSDFHSLLLEAKLIKKLQPKYNFRGRDDKSKLYIAINLKEKYPKFKILRKTEIENYPYVFGPFPNKNVTLEILRIIRKIVPFCQQPKISQRGCFYSRIGLCDPCPSEIEKIKDKNKKNKLINDYRTNIKKIINILKGNDKPILTWLEKKMKKLVKEEKFEEAIIYRNKWQIYQSLIKEKVFQNEEANNSIIEKGLHQLAKLLRRYFNFQKNFISRIEVYDISHFSEKLVVGSMICLENGQLKKADYRRFRLLKKLKDDQERLKTIIRRRFNHKWSIPDLIIIDGGRPQLQRLKAIWKSLKLSIPLIGIAKKPDRLIISNNKDLITIKPKVDDPGFNMIRMLRDEAHRFAIKYHRFLRERSLYN